MTKPIEAKNANRYFPEFTKEEYNQIRTLISKNQFCGNVTSNLDPKYYMAWVIDSGASDHISSFSHILHQTPYHNIICLPNGSQIDTLSISLVQFKLIP
jgi:hypothetical protein